MGAASALCFQKVPRPNENLKIIATADDDSKSKATAHEINEMFLALFGAKLLPL